MLWENEFEVDRLNLKMSQLLSGSFESPIQVTLLLMCWGRNKLEVPWNDPTVILSDCGHRIYLGILPGIFSTMISTLVIIKKKVGSVFCVFPFHITYVLGRHQN